MEARSMLAPLTPLLLVTLVACAALQPTPAPTPADSPPPANGDTIGRTVSSGDFRLSISLPRNVRAGQPIEGTAMLFPVPEGDFAISGSGSGIVFEYAEVDGDRRVGPAWTDDCRTYQLSRDDPLQTGLSKSGAVDSDFARDFLDGPDVRLPAGEWQVTAMIDFFEGEGCSGAQHSMRAAVQITVE